MTGTSVRRLPSADWFAIGIAVAALFLQYVFPLAAGVVVLAVFAPSILREIKVLDDGDEWTTGIMHRAGFHGLLAVGTLISLNYLLVATGWFQPSEMNQRPINLETLHKAVIWVFLVSYLIQYWGARHGVFRILLAVSLTGLAPLTYSLKHEIELEGYFLAASLVHLVAIAGLAFLVRRWPRIGAGVMLLVIAVFLALGMDSVVTPVVNEARWGMLNVWFQLGLVFGVTSIAIFRESGAKTG
ncbi:MAG: hypothetical protein ABFS42_09995 [Candidatus Krumholzibacteriota bacterium]